MATAKKIAEMIIAEAGIPASSIKSITRRLNEDGLMERGSRGHPVQNISALDCANLLLGALALSDNYGTVSNRIGVRVREVGSLFISDAPKVMYQDDSKTAIVIANQETFADALSGLLVKAADQNFAPRLSRLIQRVGVTFRGNGVGAWIEFTPDAEYYQLLSTKGQGCEVKFVPGYSGFRLSVSRGEHTALEREASLTWQSIHRIAVFGAKDNPDWGA